MKQEREFYFGLLVWLVTVVVAGLLWADGDSDILLPFTAPWLSAAAFFFLTLLAGYFLSHEAVELPPRFRQKALGFWISAASTVVLSVVFFYFGMMGCMTMMLLIQLAPIMRQRWAMLIGALVPVVLVVTDISIGKEAYFTNAIVFIIVNALALTVSYRVLSERAAKLESQQLVRELTATQILLSATSRRDERLRIARNLHDILGHQLTALNLQLEVASHVREEAKNEHIRQARTIGTTLLSNVRDTVSEFREERELELREALSALLDGIPDLETELNIELDDSLVDARQAEVMFRCAQEALTNTMRHAAATRCTISLSNDDAFLVLKVQDNGTGSKPITPGNGLTGMCERVERIDGDLAFSNTPGGFELTVQLPISES